MKKLRIVMIAGLVGLVLVAVIHFLKTPSLPENHGMVDTKLFLGQGTKQPLIVAMGGGGGGNDWERDYLREIRSELHSRGFAILAVGYFGTKHAPKVLDRISLDALADTIFSIAKRTAEVDTSQIILMGSSKGGELVLNLASRFSQFSGVIALSTTHVSFPALTLSANTSSWYYNEQEVPFVPASWKTIGPALKGDLHAAFSMMLEDVAAARMAEIEVEHINGPILILSGTQDEQWPATAMSERLIGRLSQYHFPHTYTHVPLEGGHTVPLDHFDLVYDFLERHFGGENGR